MCQIELHTKKKKPQVGCVTDYLLIIEQCLINADFNDF